MFAVETARDGRIYEGEDQSEAWDIFNKYVKRTEATRKPWQAFQVTLLQNGVPIGEWE